MLFTAATLLALTALGVNASPALELSVSGAESVDGVDNFSIVTTITNTGDEPLELYNDPRSALSNFPESTFSISDRRGNPAAFHGAKVKYSFDRATSFTSLAPGQSVEVHHDLGGAYNFTTEGSYEIEANNLFFRKDSSGKPVPIYAEVPSLFSANLKGNLVSSKFAERGIHRRATFNGCTTTERNQINTALSSGATYLDNALSYLGSAGSSSTRYRTWFGTYSSANDNTVTSHLNSVKTSNMASYTYDCTCNEDYYAYVYPNSFGYVYLCNAFWSAPNTGTDSKAGTLIHEACHFTRNGGTQDYAYGQTAAKNLAISNRARAIMNSDNREYFCENTPFQS